MKKSLLLFAALLTAVGMQAVELQVISMPAKHLTTPVDGMLIENGIARPKQHTPAKVQSRGDFLSLDFGICGDPYDVVSINDNQKKGSVQAYATELTPEVLEQFVGNSIYGIAFYTGINKQYGMNIIKSVTAFLTHDLEEEPFETKEVTLGTAYYTQTFVEFDNPYEIKAGESVYMGIKYTIAGARDLPVVIDYLAHDGYEGGWVANYADDGTPTWSNITDQYGYVCLWATIAGTNMPQDKAAAAVYDAPISVYDKNQFAVSYLIGNIGANAITSFEAEFQLGDQEPITGTYTLTGPMGYNMGAVLTIDNLNYPAAKPEPIDARITITKVNTVANTETVSNTAAAKIQVVPEGKDFKRNVVIEEFTGTWCGWCPRGIVSMERFRSEFTDGSVIPVCIHWGDEMQADDFAPLVAAVPGFPYAIVNRIFADDPDYDTMTAVIEQLKTVPAIARIDATADLDPELGVISVNTTSQFAFDLNDADKRFAICYIITEDNVGPYYQTNNYAGGGNGVLDGWEKLEKSTETTYNDVARHLTSFNGHKGSVPATVVPGTEYTYRHDIELTPELMAKKADLNVVAYLLNLQNGTIENASLVRTANIGTTGIDTVTIDNDADAPAEYFNLQGIRVENPVNGLYIRRQGKTVTKVIL